MTELDRLRFVARTNPLGPAIDLTWAQGDLRPVRILRRERRFPGLTRKGVLPIAATPADLTDGTLVFDGATFRYDFEEVRTEREASGALVTTTRQYRSGRELVRTIVERDGGEPEVTLVDRGGLDAGTVYYYTVFAGPDKQYSSFTMSSALATGRGGSSLFEALPEIDRVRDTQLPAPSTVTREDSRKGQLQRYLETFDAHADMLRGMVEGLRDVHDPRRVDARLLPRLAQLIGWELKAYLDEDAQRSELAFAPEFYRTVGTSRNIVAMVNRLTGWDARVREFVRNVLMTYDGSRVEGSYYADGSATKDGRRSAPPGSVNTADTEAMYRVRNRLPDDTTAYTYDCGTATAEGYRLGEDNWYRRDTIGIYIVPDVDTERFVPQDEWDRIRKVLAEFLPINVRAVFILLPGVAVEEEYDGSRVGEESFDAVSVVTDEDAYTSIDDPESVDRINWIRFYTNEKTHLSVNTAVAPVDTSHRTWHIGLS